MKKVFLFSVLVCFLLFSVAIHAVQAQEETRKEPVTQLSIIKKLQSAAKVGADEKFKKLLAEENHRENIEAPEKMRNFCESLPIFRTGMGISFMRENNRAVLGWWTNEVGIRGEYQDVEKKILAFLKKHGLNENSRLKLREDDRVFSGSSKEYGELVAIEGPYPFVGGKEPACGIYLTWKLTSREEIPVLTLSQVLEEIPQLRDTRVDEIVYKELGGLPVEAVATGGTWTRYYDWDVFFLTSKSGSVKNALPVEELDKKLRDLIAKMGYVSERKEDDLETFERRETGSFLFLSKPDEKGRIRFRIQPES